MKCIGSIDDVSNRPMTGRPKKVTEEESKMLIETTKAHPNLSLTQLKMESGVNISRSTCYGILKENKYKSRIAAEKWAIDEVNQASRFFWAEEYIEKPQKFWESVIFTDECQIQNNPNKQRLWLHEDEEVPATQRDPWQASVLIWGAISFSGKLIIEVVDGNMNSQTFISKF